MDQPIYSEICDKMVAPMFKTIEKLKYDQLYDWCRPSINLTRFVEGGNEVVINITRKKEHE
jgi:hypothetical protein